MIGIQKPTPHLSEFRSAALAAARSRLREIGIDPVKATQLDIENALDHIHRTAGNTLAARWYVGASKTQWKLLMREWRKWVKEQRALFLAAKREMNNSQMREQSLKFTN